MPELPEVTIMVNSLKKKVLNRTIVRVWTDTEKLFKNISFPEFEKEIKGSKIKDIFRRGKIVCFELDNNKILFIHPKMSGYFLIGRWKRIKNVWQSKQIVHLVFWLDDGLTLAFSDLRKFARIELWDKGQLAKAKIIQKLGPDALGLTLIKFEEILKKSRRKIKQTLMEQNLIAGIGNIYADEILFQAKVHPLKIANNLTKQETKKIYQAIKLILKKAIKLGGSSVSDFRDSGGGKGKFQKEFKVYRRQGQKCFVCQTKIKRQKVAGRSTHFCPKCQKQKTRNKNAANQKKQ